MSATILIVDDEENARLNLAQFLTALGYEVIGADTLAKAREILNRGEGDIILLDVQLPDGYGPALLDETAQLAVRPPIILITAHGDIDMAVDAMKSGAHDFLQKPIKLAQLQKSISRAEEVIAMRRELTHLRDEQASRFDMVVGKNPQMRQMLDVAQRAASANVSVLITGETGTGKEVLARAIHASGPRAKKPFMGINCAAIQNTMIESELFGYEAGAFTGADKRKHGLIETADGGILFLDEISSMPMDMQAKMLRALEERAFHRVGGTNLIHVDVQVIAASNRDLPAMLSDGKFRSDLYYRLKVVDLHLPPLRDRLDDIPELVAKFIARNNRLMGINVYDMTPRAIRALQVYSWPGNIRELRNVIERAMIFCDGETIDLPHLPPEIVIAAKKAKTGPLAPDSKKEPA